MMAGVHVLATTEANGDAMTLDPSQLEVNFDPPYNGFSASPEMSRSVPIKDNITMEDEDQAPEQLDMTETQSNGYAPQNNARVVVAKEPKFAPLPYSTSRTGLVYDVRMRFHVQLPDDQGLHPEDPRRIWSVFNALSEAGLVDAPNAPEPMGEYVLGRIPARFASRDEVCTIHTERYYDWVMDLESEFKGCAWLTVSY